MIAYSDVNNVKACTIRSSTPCIMYKLVQGPSTRLRLSHSGSHSPVLKAPVTNGFIIHTR